MKTVTAVGFTQLASVAPSSVKPIIDFEDVAGEGVIEGLRPLLKPGTYLAAFDTWRTALMFGGRAPKLVLVFALIEEPIGIRLERFYNVLKLIGKPRTHGRFVVGAHSNLAREFARLTNRKTRFDRITLSALAGRIYRVTVRTVPTGADQQKLPTSLHYSVIAKVDLE